MATHDIQTSDAMVDYNKMMQSMPSNSKTVSTLNQEPTERKRFNKIVKGDVKPQKKSFLKKFKEAFLPEPGMSVEDYIINDILAPGVKNILYSIGTGILGGALFGDARPDDRWRGNNKRYVSYDRISTDRRQERSESRATYKPQSVMNFEPLIMDKDDAADVLREMKTCIEEYGTVSIGHYYDMVGITCDFTEWRYGWTDLRNTPIIGVKGGWIIDFPRPVRID